MKVWLASTLAACAGLSTAVLLNAATQQMGAVVLAWTLIATYEAVRDYRRERDWRRMLRRHERERQEHGITLDVDGE